MSTKKSFPVLVALISFLAIVLSACAPLAQAGGQDKVESVSNGGAGSLEELVSDLQARGAEIQLGDEIEQPFVSVKGQSMKVNGADVQVFEYADEAARQAESAKIPEDGYSFDTVMVNWIDQPHFWTDGRLIVLYVGSDPAIIDLLSQALGEPIAG